MLPRGCAPGRGKSHLTNAEPAGQACTPRAPPAMGVRSWRERGGRPRDGAPTYVELWSTGYASSDSAGKPTTCRGRQAAGLDATRRGCRIPPGSESGACMQRGASGTGESPWFPWRTSGGGVPTGAVKTPGAGRRLAPPRRALQEQGTHSEMSATRYRGRRGRTERPRDGPLAVFADHRTEGEELRAFGREGGEPRSQGPTAGKAKPGITFVWKALWERLRAHPP